MGNLKVGIDHSTFLESYSSLSKDEQKQASAFLDKFLSDPALPSLSFKRLSKLKTKKIWACYVNMDLRAIIYREGNWASVLHIGHHDPAYRWAARNYGTLDPEKSKPILPVEIDDNFKDPSLPFEPMMSSPVVPVVVQDTTRLFDETLFKKDYLLSIGVPEVLLPTVYQIRDEEQLYTVLDDLDEALALKLLKLASGELVTPDLMPASATESEGEEVILRDLLAQRFKVLDDPSDLENLLNAPQEAWLAFLHPTQENLVKRTFNGPVKVIGAAGTGKTVVGLHRARELSRQGQTVLLTTYTKALAANLQRQLALLCTADEQARITVSTVNSIATQMVRSKIGGFGILQDTDLLKHFQRCAPVTGFEAEFLLSEWQHILQVQGLRTWAAYRNASRGGRGISLNTKERKLLWDKAFEPLYQEMEAKHKYDWTDLFLKAHQWLNQGELKSPYSAVIVDEIQDLQPAPLMFLAALAQEHPEHLMLLGDSGQRLYSAAYSFASLGISVRGRSHTLRINYRTSAQILSVAEGFSERESDDLDGQQVKRSVIKSLFEGPEPLLKGFTSESEQWKTLIENIQTLREQGYAFGEMGIFSRKNTQLQEIQDALENADIPVVRIRSDDENREDKVHLGTMHSAKGLEFKLVWVVNVSDKILPPPSVTAQLKDPADIEDALKRERNLLYVSATRARHQLFIYWVGTPSRYLSAALAVQS